MPIWAEAIASNSLNTEGNKSKIFSKLRQQKKESLGFGGGGSSSRMNKEKYSTFVFSQPEVKEIMDVLQQNCLKESSVTRS